MRLRINDVHKRYANGAGDHVVLERMDLDVAEGEFVTLLGPSGCGKTTLLNIVAGFVVPDAGSVRVGDRAVDGPGPDRGVIFQDYALFPWLTVRGNIEYPMKRLGIAPAERAARLEQLLGMAHLDGKGALYPAQLSGGMKQRTAVCRALASSPQVLLMDEPFGAVDFQMRLKLQEELERIWLENRITVLMVTHDVQEAIYMSDRVIVMSPDRGRIVEDVAIDLPRPRLRKGAVYHEYEDLLLDRLSEAFDERKTS